MGTIRCMLVVALVVAGAVFAGAAAQGLPQDGKLLLLTDLGEHVGNGALHDGLLEVRLSDTGNRFVTLQILGSDDT